MKMLAWIAFAFAVIAGAGLSITAPGLVQLIVTVALLTGLVIDIVKDHVPNLIAVAVVAALPSLIVGMNGKLAAALRGGLHWLWNQVQGPLGEWAGTSATLGVAAAAVTVSFFLGRRTMSTSGLRR